MKSQPRSGVREVVIPPLEIVAERSTADRILELFQAHKELATFQIRVALNLQYGAADRVCRALLEQGKLSRRYAQVRRGKYTRAMAIYSSSSQFAKRGA